MKRLLLAALMVAFFVSTAWAANVTFTWVPSPASDLAGYRLFQREAGASYDYNTPVAQIAASDPATCTITDVPDGDYRWVLRAFDDSGNESIDSNECSLLIDFPPGQVQSFG